MQMIDVAERQKAVKRRVDRGCYGVITEPAEWVHVYDLVFKLLPTIDSFQPGQLFEVQRRQPRQLDTSQIAAAALDPQNLFLFSAQRIGLLNFRTSVSTAKICDAKIRAQQIRAISQPLRFVETTSHLLVPAIL